MTILQVSTNYFYGFHDIACYKQNDTKTNALALLKIITYFTVVIPLCFSLLFTALSLYGRVRKIESLSQQDLNIRNQAEKMIIEPRATPQEIRDAAKKAAEGEFCCPGNRDFSFQKLFKMIRCASIKEIPYIIEGALSYEYSTGIKNAIGELLRRRDLGGPNEKEKLKLSVKTIPEKRLLKLIDKSKLPSLSEQFRYRINFDFYNDMELELLQKYGKELSLSDECIKQIGEYIEHIKSLCEITKDKPQKIYP